jgi:hypothetical protein
VSFQRAARRCFFQSSVIAPGRFRFSSHRENAPALCFKAIPDAKPVPTFAEIALEKR